MTIYSAQDATLRFDEILQKVRAGERVMIEDQGEDVAEVLPVRKSASMMDAVRELEEQGIISPLVKPEGELIPIARIPGALDRFLESRD
jgi:antitoxin (DNA-binding transcriptional repressor) of toxin-antitoxin stability system